MLNVETTITSTKEHVSSNNNNATSLPQDVLLNIDAYLWPEDRYACLFVCRQWYTSFLTKFYTNITIQTALQCEKLCNLLDMTIAPSQTKGQQQQQQSLGHAARELHLDLSAEDLEKLPSSRLTNQLPSLRSFTVSSFHHNNNNNKSPHSCKTNDEENYGVVTTAASMSSSSCGKIAPSRSIIGISIDTFWTLPSTTLTKLHFSIPRLQREATIRLLRKLPRLTSLYLNWINGSWLCSDMDAVHQYCPELRQIWIFAETFHTLSQVQEQRPRPNHPIDEDEEAESIFDTVDIMEHPEQVVDVLFPPPPHVLAVAKKLTHFHLSIYRGLPDHMSDWFVYAGRTYPNLKSFTLETRPKHLDRVGERAFEYDLLDMLMTYKWASRTWKQAEIPSFRYFVQRCPHVTAINLFQLYLNRQFLGSIFACGLPVKHFGSTRNIHSIWTAEDNWYFSESLVSLSLQACITPPATNATFMKFLGSLAHLKHLTLARYEHFALPSLLDACPGLETLVLEHLAITSPSRTTMTIGDNTNNIDDNINNLTFTQQLQQRQWGQWQSNFDDDSEEEDEAYISLKQLTIRQAVLKESFFDDIPSSVKSLTVEDSAIIGADIFRATIQMPSLDLDTLIINHLLFEAQNSMRKVVKQTGQQFSVIGVQCSSISNNRINSTTQWYDFRDTRKQLDERILGIRPMAPKDAEEMLEDDEGTTDEAIYGLEVSCRSIQKACINNLRLLDAAAQHKVL
ncbi:hypothetical protein BDA99DRAFT_518284 [Phascolomyces articulosus]|uniref:F-box domain-containing protein n=1 Tax=Phascolomyces articulosus TaxID=60185 RepID=A0AAD5K4X8_9FUNG|nr:hypothetical protein BDA99DRAFT_518284 [Phascolomyces articulosus]